jgi:hypothetical protein
MPKPTPLFSREGRGWLSGVVGGVRQTGTYLFAPVTMIIGRCGSEFVMDMRVCEWVLVSATAYWQMLYYVRHKT